MPTMDEIRHLVLFF